MLLASKRLLGTSTVHRLDEIIVRGGGMIWSLTLVAGAGTREGPVIEILALAESFQR